jgi:hypothetical protein
MASSLSFAFEIRAYSMEIAAVVATGYALHRVVRDPGLVNHLLLGAVCSVGLWSRYSFVVVAGGQSARWPACARGPRPPRDELERLACLLVPFPQQWRADHRVSLRYHAGQLGPLGGNRSGPPVATIQAPDYVKPWVLTGQSLGTAATVLRENLLSAPALPITLTLGALALWPLVRQWRALRDWPGARSFPAVATMALLAQVISAVLSLTGLYPWNLGQKWSLYLHGVSIVCVLYLASAGWWVARRSRAAPALAVAALAVVVIVTMRGASFRRTHWADVSPALAQLETMPLRQGSVFVDIHDVPTLRYFYELGPRRGLGATRGVSLRAAGGDRDDRRPARVPRVRQ